jgi:predicted O-linked N-acetylglucosamine transferase (SPINDLY family)
VLIVTPPSPFMRGRLTYAMYRPMDIPDLVAANPADYVRLAVRLGTEPDYREPMRRRTLEMSGVLYEDVAVVREVERMLLAAAGR